MNEPMIMPRGVEEAEPGRAERILYPENARYRRIRSISNLMDRSIVLPSGYRIGVDPLLGLVPGIGDALCTLVSCYLVYESARLGVQKRVLLRMMLNIAAEGLVGAIPVLGDVFDAVWKANVRNLRLLDAHYHPGRKERSAGRMLLWVLALALPLLVAMATTFYMMARLLSGIFNLLFRLLGIG